MDTGARIEKDTNRGPWPAAAVAVEFGRALCALLVVPLHIFWHLLVAKRRAREVAACLGGSAEPTPVPSSGPPRALHLFVSCAEPSGEIHARTFVDRAPSRLGGELRFSGVGGPGLAALGVQTIADPVSHARMGFAVVAALPFYLRLLTDVARHLRNERPDVAVFIDSPALHVPMGRIARAYGVPVLHVVTPQYWGWAPWRVRGYRSAVDLGLSILPFEVPWYAARRVRAAHIGHPLQDRLANVPRRARPLDDGPIVLLPGSRASVVRRNLPWMLAQLVAAPPGSPLESARAVIALGRADLADDVRAMVRDAKLESRVELAVGDLHEVLSTCRAAFAVSGTVLLDVLHHRLPMVVIYRLGGRFEAWLTGRLLTVPYFASVNLLAGRAIVPEFGFAGEGPGEDVRRALEELMEPGPARELCLADLEVAAERLGDSGAIDRALGWAAVLARGSNTGSAAAAHAFDAQASTESRPRVKETLEPR